MEVYHSVFISQGTTIKILPWVSEKPFDLGFTKSVQTLMTMGKKGILQHDMTKHLWGSRVDCRDLNEKYPYSLKYLNICSLYDDSVWRNWRMSLRVAFESFINLSCFLFSRCFIFMVEDMIPQPLSTCFHASQSSVNLPLEP